MQERHSSESKVAERPKKGIAKSLVKSFYGLKYLGKNIVVFV